MPKLIDHAQRQAEIAEATWRVILREGISGTSIRTIAAEAGVSTGSLRHVFPSKTALLVHAMQLVNERVYARISRHMTDPDPRRLVLAVIHELLPLDADRRAELEINIALIAEAPTSVEIAKVRDEAYEALREACERMVAHLQRNGLAASSHVAAEKAADIHALLDGFALHILMDESIIDHTLRAVEAWVDGLR